MPRPPQSLLRRLIRPAVFRARKLAVALLLTLPATIWAAWHVESWGTDRGLPNSTVGALAQTREGYWWAGTPGGLARFDGVRFTVFNAQTTPELGSGGVKALLTDSAGALWIVTGNGALVRWKDGSFIECQTQAASDPISSLAAAADDAIWFLTDAGKLGVVRNGGFHAAPTNLPALEGPLQLLTGHVGAVRLRGAREMVLVSGRDGMPERVAFSDAVVPLAPSRAGGWWFLWPDGARLWREGGWTIGFALARELAGDVRLGLETSQGQLWLGTAQHGVLCLSTNAPPQRFTTGNGLGSDTVLCLFEDARGAIWAGTERGGLARFRRTPFRAFGKRDGLSSEFVTSVCAGADGEVWVGTDGGGLNRIKDGRIEQFSATKGPPTSRVRAVCMDATESLWVAAQGGQLLLREAGVWKDRSALLTGVSPVSALFEDARWQLWVGGVTPNDLLRVVSDAPRRFAVPNATPTLDVRAFAEDAAGDLWFGTEGSGLFRWDGRNFRQFTRADGLGADTVWALHADRAEKVLWIGTSGGGLSRWDGHRLTTCTMRHGLHDDTICDIRDDGLGWLWFASHRGIFRVAKWELRDFFGGGTTALHSVEYDLGDGLPTLDCSGGFQPAGCRTSDGRLWFPTAKGLVEVNPAAAPPDREPPRVLIEQLLVDDVPIQPPAAGGAGISIPPGRHRVVIQFTGLGVEAPEQVKFRCQLEGFDPGWIELGTQRSAQYSGLRPGAYRFHVIAKNRDGVWNEAGAALAFRLQPQVWQTWWFQAAGGLLLATGLALLVTWILRRRHRASIERLQHLHAVEQERARIAQDIHDDLGASLTQIALLSELAQSQLDEPQAARGHLDHIFTSARNLARATDEIVWALHPKNNAVELSLNFLTRFAQEYLRVAGIACRLDLPTELPDVSLPSATRHHLYLALKEALNNVVKHANATEVWLRLACGEGQLSLTIEDNGCGFDPQRMPADEKPPPSVRRGHGLDSMAQRLKAAGGAFKQTSAPGKGTATRFTVPLHE